MDYMAWMELQLREQASQVPSFSHLIFAPSRNDVFTLEIEMRANKWGIGIWYSPAA
jgi:hypothetical protein